MAQLVELKKNNDKFADRGVEVIAVFREEKQGLEGLQKTKDKTGVPFTLALDLGAEHTAAYSPGKWVFNSYVVDSSGTVRAIVEGDLRNRAKSEQLLNAIESLTDER